MKWPPWQRCELCVLEKWFVAVGCVTTPNIGSCSGSLCGMFVMCVLRTVHTRRACGQHGTVHSARSRSVSLLCLRHSRPNSTESHRKQTQPAPNSTST
eukprot:COSAG01_NODE_6533_length_3617_cov_1.487493_4_plen_98_part_00